MSSPGHDRYGNRLTSTSPAEDLLTVVPSDTVDLSPVCRALYVGTGGNVAIMALNDTAAVTLANVPDGTILPIMTKRVLVTGTTASNIVGLA